MLLSAALGLRLSPRSLRACLGTLVMAFCLCPMIGHAQSADVFGVRYEPQVQLAGRDLQLNGTGVAYRALVKLYTVGL